MCSYPLPQRESKGLPNPETDSPDTKLEAMIIGKLLRRLLPVLFFLYVVAYLDRINIGFAALQMQKQLHLSDASYGLGAGIFFAGYVLFQLPSNLGLERVGARRWISMLMVTWGIISCSMIFVRLPWHLYTLRFLLGSAEAGFFPGIILYLKNWFPITARARTVAWFSAAGPVSAIIGGPISGTLLRLQRAGLAGWQWMFILEGLPAILLGIGVLFYLTDTPDNADWLPLEWRACLSRAMRRECLHSTTRAAGGMFEVFTSINIWLMVCVYFGVNCAGYGMTFWLPSVIRSLSGIDTTGIGFLSAIPYAAALVGMVLVGRHSDRSGEYRWHIAGPAFVGAVALLLAGYSASVGAMITAISVAVVAEFSMVGPFWAMSTTIQPRHAAAAIALINSIGNLGGLLGSYGIGALRNSSTGFRAGMASVGIGLGIAGCLMLLVRARPPHVSATPDACSPVSL
jgi:MFS transporter, ACS family, tartrate transporter